MIAKEGQRVSSVPEEQTSGWYAESAMIKTTCKEDGRPCLYKKSVTSCERYGGGVFYYGC